MTAASNGTDTEDRDALMIDFLRRAGWDSTARALLTADASTRRYHRLSGGEMPALLMDAPPGAETAACPPDADEAVRRELGYNAMARLAGPRLEAFTSLADFLRDAGVRTPRIFADDPVHGFAVIEDFGDRLLAQAVEAGADEASLYAEALKTIRPLQKKPMSPGPVASWPLQTYDHVAYEAEVLLLPEWYAPHRDVMLQGDAVEAYVAIWRELLAELSEPRTLTLRDFHAENILVAGDGALAVIDFQDALIGQAAYDVVSLLEDARRDVDLGLAAELVTEEARLTPDSHAFMTDYAILAAQRNAKILGIFARLTRRDGKPKYDALLPRVEDHFRRDLERPAVASLRPWFEQYLPRLLSDYRGQS
ncbi:MAG: phosphotransferase [Pseudomonadota bacterium]